ncbi:hypothetical protein BU17DRAFT_62219 [Hysterangium stoloniferum]|nr:hypothetical protein BU17DRAFT_62219 [Hysterangium stoloniferum]
MSATGQFITTEIRAWDDLKQQTAKQVTFDTPYSAPPSVQIGLNTVDIDKSTNVRVKVTASNITNTGFTANGDTWSDTKLYTAGASWLEIAADKKGFERGQFSTLDDHPWNKPQTTTCRRICFDCPYPSPPKVVSYLKEFDMSNSSNWRCKTFVTDVDCNGFSLHIDTWSDSILYSATAGWVAYPSGQTNIASGSVNTMDVRPWNQPALENSGKVTFPDGTFSGIPAVFFVINSFDIGNTGNFRLKAYFDNVFNNELTWHLDSWSDTVLYSAGASYIAFI